MTLGAANSGILWASFSFCDSYGRMACRRVTRQTCDMEGEPVAEGDFGWPLDMVPLCNAGVYVYANYWFLLVARLVCLCSSL